MRVSHFLLLFDHGTRGWLDNKSRLLSITKSTPCFLKHHLLVSKGCIGPDARICSLTPYLCAHFFLNECQQFFCWNTGLLELDQHYGQHIYCIIRTYWLSVPLEALKTGDVEQTPENRQKYQLSRAASGFYRCDLAFIRQPLEKLNSPIFMLFPLIMTFNVFINMVLLQVLFEI